MNKKSFFIKYQNNQAVLVRTHIFNSNNFQWIKTIFNVSDLIQAATQEPIRKLLGLPIEFGPLSLYSVVSGVETLLKPGCSLDDIDTGHSEETCLCLKTLKIESPHSENTQTIREEINIRQLIEEGIRPLHRSISELRKPITERMSACSSTKFNAIQKYFSLRFEEIQWNIEGLALPEFFEWNGRGEDECIPDLISLFSNRLSPYQFRDSRSIQVAVEYLANGYSSVQNGKLDITVLLPNQIATMPVTILSQCIAAIEIKTPMALLEDINKCIHQSRLQLLALNSGGNIRYPFALLTNATDYWRFTWLSMDNCLFSILFNNQEQGLAALYDGLQMMNSQPNSCPFTNRCGVALPDFNGHGDDDVADMSEFYDDMTEMEVFQHKSKIGLNKFFQLLTPSQKANFII